MSDQEKRIQETCEDCVRNGTGQCLICRRKNDLVNTVDYFSVIPENAPPIVRQLLRVYEEHKNDKFYTFQINYPLMAKDAANEIMRLTDLLESLQREQEPEGEKILLPRKVGDIVFIDTEGFMGIPLPNMPMKVARIVAELYGDWGDCKQTQYVSLEELATLATEPKGEPNG